MHGKYVSTNRLGMRSLNDSGSTDLTDPGTAEEKTLDREGDITAISQMNNHKPEPVINVTERLTSITATRNLTMLYHSRVECS